MQGHRRRRATQRLPATPISPKGGGGTASISLSYAHLGEKDEAFEWLEKAFEEGGAMSSLMGLKVDPTWDPLRDDPRFQDLLLRMNLEP